MPISQGIPDMLIFLASLATLVAVSLVTRLAQRSDALLGGVPSLHIPE